MDEEVKATTAMSTLGQDPLRKHHGSHGGEKGGCSGCGMVPGPAGTQDVSGRSESRGLSGRELWNRSTLYSMRLGHPRLARIQLSY